jgi:hypothetical protein
MIMRKIGILVILLGVAMFFYGAGMFCYAGPPLNPFISRLALLSFDAWWATIIFGIILLIVFKREK